MQSTLILPVLRDSSNRVGMSCQHCRLWSVRCMLVLCAFCSRASQMETNDLMLQGFAFQCLSSRLGIVTGLNLAQHCGQEYPKLPRYLMWFCMEIAIIGADIQEVIGSAIAIALLSNNVIPLWAGMHAGCVFLNLDACSTHRSMARCYGCKRLQAQA
jgi:hypothetical protein